MNRRERWITACVVAATVAMATASYLFDRWLLASDLPDWLKAILLHGAG